MPKHAESSIEFFPGSRKPIPGGIKLLRVNTTYFKGRLARKLGVKSGGRNLRIPESAFNDYLKNPVVDPDEDII